MTLAASRNWFSWPLAVTMLTWAFNFVALKLLYRQVPPAAVSLIRYFPMWATLAAICWIQRESLRMPAGLGWRVHVQGFLSLGLYMVLFLEGLARTGGAEGAVLLATGPVMTALVAIAAGQERFRLSVLAGALAAFAGVAVVVLAGSPPASGTVSASEHGWGVAMVLAAALVWAVSTVVSRPLLSELSPLRMLTLSMPTAAVLLVPFGWQATAALDWSGLDWVSWLTLFHVTMLAGVVGFLGFYAGVRQVGAAGAMLYQYFVPPIAALLEWAILGKTLQPLQFVGFGIVVAGITLAMRARTAQPAAAEGQ